MASLRMDLGRRGEDWDLNGGKFGPFTCSKGQRHWEKVGESSVLIHESPATLPAEFVGQSVGYHSLDSDSNGHAVF